MMKTPQNVRFNDLLKVCKEKFGEPRIRGSHHIFQVPWEGNPRINIQAKRNMAREYQVKQVLKALQKLAEESSTP